MAVAPTTLTAEGIGPAVCPNCGTEFLGDFCHRCGEQKHHVEELTLKHFFLHATHDLTHLDTKIFATLRYLLTRPGFLTQEFIAGRRSRYMRPFSLFLVACAIFFLADSIRPISGFDAHQLTAMGKNGKVDALWEQLAKAKHVPKEIIVERIQETIHRVSTVAQIFNALAVAAVLALLFRKRYFVEHMVFAMHFLSFTYLGGLLLSLLNSANIVMNVRNVVSFMVSSLVFLAYLFIATRKVYGQGVIATLFKTIITYAVTLAFYAVTFLAALVIAVVRAATAK